MAEITRFQDIQAWQKGRELARHIYRVSGQGDFIRDYALRDQIRRAAISVVSNIAEGFDRGGNREFVQFLSQAKGSVGEIESQLYVALDAGLLSQTDFEQLYSVADETARLIAGFMRYLGQSELQGPKYRPRLVGGRSNARKSESTTRNSELGTRN